MAGPIILANVSVPLLGAVDTAVVGHLPEPHYIGAVAIGAMLFNYIYHLFNCLRMGTTAPTAQARGAGNHAEVRAVLGRALLLGVTIGAAVIVLQLPIIALAFSLIDASPQVERYAREYFLIRVWSMRPCCAPTAIGWIRAARAKTPLVSSSHQPSERRARVCLRIRAGLGCAGGGKRAAHRRIQRRAVRFVLRLAPVARVAARRGTGAASRPREARSHGIDEQPSGAADALRRFSPRLFHGQKRRARRRHPRGQPGAVITFWCSRRSRSTALRTPPKPYSARGPGQKDRAAFQREERRFLWAGMVGVFAVGSTRCSDTPSFR